LGTLIWGIILILAGASGEFALPGTNSSGALMIAGLAVAGFGIYRLATRKEREAKSRAEMARLQAEAVGRIQEQYERQGSLATTPSDQLSKPIERIVIVGEHSP
jgi:hypothetical protein